ncbi:MAG: type B 50S ribosomal protein L31 [Patescibacteria group bacterium]
MKADIHPQNYRPVIFEDKAVEAQFLIGSTVETEEKGTWTNGVEYPLYRVEVSSASHPFYTGTEKVMDSGGRVERFKQRMDKAEKK